MPPDMKCHQTYGDLFTLFKVQSEKEAHFMHSLYQHQLFYLVQRIRATPLYEETGKLHRPLRRCARSLNYGLLSYCNLTINQTFCIKTNTENSIMS